MPVRSHGWYISLLREGRGLPPSPNRHGASLDLLSPPTSLPWSLPRPCRDLASTSPAAPRNWLLPQPASTKLTWFVPWPVPLPFRRRRQPAANGAEKAGAVSTPCRLPSRATTAVTFATSAKTFSHATKRHGTAVPAGITLFVTVAILLRTSRSHCRAPTPGKQSTSSCRWPGACRHLPVFGRIATKLVSCASIRRWLGHRGLPPPPPYKPSLFLCIGLANTS